MVKFNQGSDRNLFGLFQDIMEKIAYFPRIEIEKHNHFL